MKTIILVFFYSSLLSLGFMDLMMAQNINRTPAVSQGSASNFSGSVRVTTLVAANTETDCIVSSVTFEAKARTFWHTHPNGQLLVVTQGTGYYQEKDKPIQLIREGESVTIPPGVTHWHGAGPSSQFTHIAINPNCSKGGAVTWLQAVTDEEYDKVPN
ncbi:(R)-mandelonitrile lyase [Larkinella sp. GY13]|jgi:quercetin dioxygenase-like cupin family protein|uniref:(R)-mandelonitrile lyase n=1 Tax=Larkinella sp. GY13 TaxID=3453720 RepID=UPI003EEB3C8B